MQYATGFCKQSKTLLVSIAVLAMPFVAICSDDKLKQRMDFWRETVNREIPLGSSIQAIKSWAGAHALKVWGDTSNITIPLEKVVDEGIGLPCSDWNIQLILKLNSQERSYEQKIITPGSCL